MTGQASLFSPANLAGTVVMPPAPELVPHTAWRYPGMTPEDSARASAARTELYTEMLAAVIKSKGGQRLTTKEVLAAVPQDWKDLCGKYAHGNFPYAYQKEHGIESAYVDHEGGGFHFEYWAETT